MNNKGFFLFVVLLVFGLSTFSGCIFNKASINSNGATEASLAGVFFKPGEMIRISGQLEFSLQNLSILPHIQLLNHEAKFESLPHIYFHPDQQSIIKIQEDGNTVYTSVEMVDSNNYEVAWIVEKTDQEKHTNAPYTIDIHESKIYPKSPAMSFALINLFVSNISRSELHINQLSHSLQTASGELFALDSILSETILINSPDITLKPGESKQVQWLALVPSDSSSLILTVEERKIEWKRS
jgi:hypothetical protein